MAEPFDEELLKMKRTRFLETVRAACDEFGIEYPYVNMSGCPGESGNLSHFHPDLYTICVSDRQLHMMNFDDIKEVATHEVTHIFEPNHCSRFVDIHTDIKTKTWKPPKGLFVISSDSKRNKQIKLTRRESTTSIGNRECNYYHCVRKDNLSQCKFCNDWFCESHLSPVMIGVADLAHERVAGKPSYDEWRHIIRDRKFNVERTKLGHPCPDYNQNNQKIDQHETEAIRYRGYEPPASTLNEGSSKMHTFRPVYTSCPICVASNSKSTPKYLLECKRCNGWYCTKHISPKISLQHSHDPIIQNILLAAVVIILVIWIIFLSGARR